MIWKLWLDDQSYDSDAPERHAPEGYIVACSTVEACTNVTIRGLPQFIDFDHDLGENDNAMMFLRWIESTYFWLDDEGTVHIPPCPDYKVHSANPVGADNIKSFMESWKKVGKR
jgi:hypothetical protein